MNEVHSGGMACSVPSPPPRPPQILVFSRDPKKDASKNAARRRMDSARVLQAKSDPKTAKFGLKLRPRKPNIP